MAHRTIQVSKCGDLPVLIEQNDYQTTKAIDFLQPNLAQGSEVLNRGLHLTESTLPFPVLPSRPTNVDDDGCMFKE